MTASPAPGAGPDNPEPPWTPPRNAAAWAQSTSQTLARGSAGTAAPTPPAAGVGAQLREPAGGRLALGDRRGADDLVDRPQVGVGGLSDREVEGVADDQAADDDRGAEHRAGHDQGGLAAAAGDLAQGEAAQERPAAGDGTARRD